MPKFVLIDQSIREFGGHHFEYAVHVLRAAQQAGQKVILGVNREFRHDASGQDKWEVHPVYEFDFWGVSGKVRHGYHRLRRLRKAAKGLLLRFKLRAGISWLGLLWTMRHNPRQLFDMDGMQHGRSLWWALLLGPAMYGLVVLRALKRFLGALTRPIRVGYPREVAETIWGILVALLYPVRFFLSKREELLRWYLKRKQVAAFGRDTRTLFERVELTRGDHVFIPTLSELDMLGLMRYLQNDDPTKHVTWHLLFRRNIYTGREPDYASQDGQLHSLRRAFHLFKESVPDHSVHFYTDTDPLTVQWNRLNAVPFVTLPIPVNEAFQHPEDEAKGSLPLRVTYVGDARSEKGYQFLPSIIRSVWNEYVTTGKLRFIFQSNFAFQNPEGQAEVVMARTLMEQMDPDKVTILKKPLDTDGYRDLVLSSDIGVLLYDRNNYYARSSGVLVESLSAGIPTIVPSGSWLSEQVAHEIYRHQYGLRYQLPLLKGFAASSLRWGVTGAADTNPLIGRDLTFSGESARAWTWVNVPKTASHMLVSFRQTDLSEEAFPGTFVHVHATQVDEHEYELRSGGHVLGQAPKGSQTTALFPLAANCQRIWLGLKNAYGEHPVSVTDLQIEFLSAEGRSIPLGAVGLIATTPEQVPDLLRNMADHYEHYRQTALAFAGKYTAYHNPDRLVADLLERGILPPATLKGGHTR